MSNIHGCETTQKKELLPRKIAKNRFNVVSKTGMIFCIERTIKQTIAKLDGHKDKTNDQINQRKRFFLLNRLLDAHCSSYHNTQTRILIAIISSITFSGFVYKPTENLWCEN